uniref:NEDD4-binding protein 2-like 2 n=1 Tax=Pyxicephalus adspersus TaxID=30357 RepID=A0AAV3AZW3_PYXAD|nr:TPA: hypothetical protein GDO54_000385 [Pyxicephalus adspersus]
MDYELRQFYKELHALEAVTDDHNTSQTVAESRQHFTCYSSNPTIHQVRDHHSQTSSPQPCNPLVSKPPTPNPPTYYRNEASFSPTGRPAFPHINNQDSCARPLPFVSTNSFVSKSLPPPGFQGPPPPTFVVHHGPPPPRYNFPIINQNHVRPSTQEPSWHSSHVPPEKRFSPQGRGYTDMFPRPPVQSSHQTYWKDICEQKGRHVDEQLLPQGDNVPYEQYPPRFSDKSKRTDYKKVLVLLRGVPGSGKSTLARSLLDQSPNGIVFSTDDYFCQENGYAYDVKLLGDAHCWNQNRARKAMNDGRSPIIIDNTNIQSWEMKPYVQMAIERGYGVEFLEPNTWWKLDPHELEKRNTHRVPREKISKMLERFEHNINIGVVMNSVEPRRVRPSRPPLETRQRWGASVDCTQHSTSFQIR